MLHHVSAEEFWLLNHTMTDGGSVEQMKAVGMPNSNTDMTGVETTL